MTTKRSLGIPVPLLLIRLLLTFVAIRQRHGSETLAFVVQLPTHSSTSKGYLVFPPTLHLPQNLVLYAKGGMGMAKPKTNKKGTSSKSTSTSTTPFDVNASLIRLEKLYDELTTAHAKTLQKETIDENDIVISEYVVAVRSPKMDWVPVAQLLTARRQLDADTDLPIDAVVSLYCRELYLSATMGSRVFQSIPRQQLQYSVEPTDCFFKHVYEIAVEGKHDDDTDTDHVMTKTTARQVLQVEAGDELSTIKQQYRSRSFALHPDRLANDLSHEEREAKMSEFARVKQAYETLLSAGLRHQDASWYESLGGRARTDFRFVNLQPIAEAQQIVKSHGIQTALIGLSPSLVQNFVARTVTI